MNLRTGQTQITPTHRRHTHTNTLLQYISWETAATYSEWGYALLSQLVRGFSKSQQPVSLSFSQTHTHIHIHSPAYPSRCFNLLKHHLSLATTATQEL